MYLVIHPITDHMLQTNKQIKQGEQEKGGKGKMSNIIINFESLLANF